jgi:hypothetical protein
MRGTDQILAAPDGMHIETRDQAQRRPHDFANVFVVVGAQN